MFLEPIVFGILQGIFEWLPISSQGNLVLLMMGFFGYSIKNALNFSIFLHTGTLLAAAIYFRNEIKDIFLNLKNYKLDFKTRENKLTSFLLISTIFTGLIGFILYKFLIFSAFTGELFLALIGIALIFTGIIQKFSKSKETKTQENLNLKDSILVGLFQGLSVIPGISRSGITISYFLFRNYKAEDSLKLSFLMSIPTVFIAEIGLQILNNFPTNILYSFLGLIFSFIFGLISIHALLKLAKKIKFWIFCFLIGFLALLPLIFSLIKL